MTPCPDDDEHATIPEMSDIEGDSIREAATCAARSDVAQRRHRDRVFAAARRVMKAHAEVINHLGR